MRALSLFCGAGGMDLGFKQAGFQITWANDINQYAVKTYEGNLGLKPLCKNIASVRAFPPAEVVLGCNPCQGYSVAGKRDPKDPRNYLYREVVRCLKQVQPQLFVVENVKGLATLYQGKFLRLILKSFEKAGYNVYHELLNAKHYGAPQDRERIFIVGVRKDIPTKYAFPNRTHGPGFRPYVTLREALHGLRISLPKEEYYDGPFRFYYMSRNRRRGWNEVSYCIQSHAEWIPLHPSSPRMVFKSKDHWAFTDRRSRYRRLSPRECARIQTFPDTFEFYGPLQSRYRQIGNAVPPRLARVIARSLLEVATAKEFPEAALPHS